MPENNRLMIFIDGSNVFRSMQRFRNNYRLDYKKLVEKLTEDRNLIRVYYFASSAVPPIKSQTNFYEALEINHNFRTIIKPLKGSGNRRREKGVDVALVTDFLSLGYKKAYDIGIIVSGDQDYAPAIEKVQDLGIQIEIASFRHSIGRDLLKVCDRRIYLDDIANDIEK